MVSVEINGVKFRCPVCGGEQFFYHEIKMNPTGASFIGRDRANTSAYAAVCINCDYIHQFHGPSHKVHKTQPSGGGFLRRLGQVTAGADHVWAGHSGAV